LRDNGLAQAEGPVEIVVHHLDDFRIIGQGDDGVVPVLVRFEGRITFEVVKEAGGLDDLQGIRRRRQHDGQQVVRVKGDWSYQLLEFGSGEDSEVLLGNDGPTVADRVAVFIDGYLPHGGKWPHEHCCHEPEGFAHLFAILHSASEAAKSTDLPDVESKLSARKLNTRLTLRPCFRLMQSSALQPSSCWHNRLKKKNQ